jgi:hypothetical protein
MPVVRNPQYNFREGFCWSLINGTRSENDLKFRISAGGVNDVGGMSLHSVLKSISEKYIVCIGKSRLISRYTESFVNFTVNFQMNDARQIPIIIPTKAQLEMFEILFDLAVKLKKEENASNLNEIDNKLLGIQEKLDKMVKELYDMV